MNLQYLRYAVEVARTGSISQAAENLFMSQPSLSKSIHELESSLGVQLFKRTSRGVCPTPEGEDLLLHARSILSQAEKIETLYQSNLTSPVRFHLAATPSLYISEAFANFCAKAVQENESRRLNLSLHEMHRLQVIDAVASGSCDAGVLRCRADEEMMLASILSRKRLDSTPLGTYHLRLALDPHHPLAAAESITQEMLSPYPRVTLDAGAVENLVLFESELQEPVQEHQPHQRVQPRQRSGHPARGARRLHALQPCAAGCGRSVSSDFAPRAGRTLPISGLVHHPQRHATAPGGTDAAKRAIRPAG